MEPTATIALPDGRSLDLYESGAPDGEVLLYHHGTPSVGMPPAALAVAAAERGLRLLATSRPGYGSSTRHPGRDVAAAAEDAGALLDSLGVEWCRTVGWSGGGPHALACAALLPERVAAAATIGGVAPYPAEGIDWFEGMGAENVEEFGAALEGQESLVAFKERAWPELRAIAGEEVAASLGDLVDDVDRASLTRDFADWLAASMREALRLSYWGWFDDDMAFALDWGFDLSGIRVPVHVWQGGHDRMVPRAHGTWLAACIPHATLHLDPAHGHLTLVTIGMDEILDTLLEHEF